MLLYGQDGITHIGACYWLDVLILKLTVKLTKAEADIGEICYPRCVSQMYHNKRLQYLAESQMSIQEKLLTP